MITTFFAFSLLIMNIASVLPWTASLPTTRENVGYLPSTRTTLVADEEIAGRPFLLKSGPTAITS